MHLPEYDRKDRGIGRTVWPESGSARQDLAAIGGRTAARGNLENAYRGANVLIMDEPTAVLAPQEIEGLFETLRSMIAQGKSLFLSATNCRK